LRIGIRNIELCKDKHRTRQRRAGIEPPTRQRVIRLWRASQHLSASGGANDEMIKMKKQEQSIMILSGFVDTIDNNLWRAATSLIDVRSACGGFDVERSFL